ncbi:MAG: type III secretion system export apparatus subunit SctR [Pseudomonadota bacterium]
MGELPNPLTLIGVATAIGLLPFVVVMATSFIKISIVLSLIRNALGVQQVPPNMVIYGISLVLTAYIMAPVGVQTLAALDGVDLTAASTEELFAALADAAGPFRNFLLQHTADDTRLFFIDTAMRLWPPEMRDDASDNNLLILLPAFTLTELKEAFEIGFLIYLPFVAIDLIISNILLAMGMMMVSPMTISLPFKLLLFVMLDGWTRLLHGLVLSYQ